MGRKTAKYTSRIKRAIFILMKKALLTCVLLTIAYVLWLVARCFIFDYFSIPSMSMSPTLKSGDKVVVNKLLMGARIYCALNFSPKGTSLSSWRTKGLRMVQRNDIVVFNNPYHDGKVNFVINDAYCKRILALPGDSLWTENGYYRNNNYDGALGIETEQRRFSAMPDTVFSKEVLSTFPHDNEHFSGTIKNMYPVYVPRHGDIINITPHEAAYYKVLLEWELGKEVTWSWGDNMAYADGRPLRRHEFRHNYYFMAGDNVVDSNDSRYWGLVPEEYIIGIVGFVYHKQENR